MRTVLDLSLSQTNVGHIWWHFEDQNQKVMMCYWHLVGRDQGCFQTSSSNDTWQPPTTENHLAPFGTGAEVDRPWSRLPRSSANPSFHAILAGLEPDNSSCSEDLYEWNAHNLISTFRLNKILSLVKGPSTGVSTGFCIKLMMKGSSPQRVEISTFKHKGMVFRLPVPTAPLHPAPGTELLALLDCLLIGSSPSCLCPQAGFYWPSPWHVPRSCTSGTFAPLLPNQVPIVKSLHSKVYDHFPFLLIYTHHDYTLDFPFHSGHSLVIHRSLS